MLRKSNLIEYIEEKIVGELAIFNDESNSNIDDVDVIVTNLTDDNITEVIKQYKIQMGLIIKTPKAVNSEYEVECQRKVILNFMNTIYGDLIDDIIDELKQLCLFISDSFNLNSPDQLEIILNFNRLITQLQNYLDNSLEN